MRGGLTALPGLEETLQVPESRVHRALCRPRRHPPRRGAERAAGERVVVRVAEPRAVPVLRKLVANGRLGAAWAPALPDDESRPLELHHAPADAERRAGEAQRLAELRALAQLTGGHLRDTSMGGHPLAQTIRVKDQREHLLARGVDLGLG